MSILNVEHLSHGFGDRAIFEDVSFRLLKGEHIGLIGANGEGKSTFMSVVTGKLQPDEGKIVMANHVVVAYLPQNPVFDVEKSVISAVVEKAMEAKIQKKQNRLIDKQDINKSYFLTFYL